jgi:hypothetical protein
MLGGKLHDLGQREAEQRDDRAGGPDVDGECRVGKAPLELLAEVFLALHARRHLLG